jgi:hypothetical protein
MRTKEENPDIKELSKNPKGQRKRERRRKKNIVATLTSRKMMKKWPTLLEY